MNYSFPFVASGPSWGTRGGLAQPKHEWGHEQTIVLSLSQIHTTVTTGVPLSTLHAKLKERGWPCVARPRSALRERVWDMAHNAVFSRMPPEACD